MVDDGDGDAVGNVNDYGDEVSSRLAHAHTHDVRTRTMRLATCLYFWYGDGAVAVVENIVDAPCVYGNVNRCADVHAGHLEPEHDRAHAPART